MWGQPPSAVRRAQLGGLRFHLKDAFVETLYRPGRVVMIQLSLSRHFRAGLSRAAASRLKSAGSYFIARTRERAREKRGTRRGSPLGLVTAGKSMVSQPDELRSRTAGGGVPT